MSKPKAILFSGYGIHREEEGKFGFEKAGAEAEIVHINDLIDGRKKLSDYQIMYLPGGFSYGDDTGSGNAYANRIKNHLWEEVQKFATQDKLILGICNGFQMMTILGLVPGFEGELGQRKCALRYNSSARLECRWVDMKVVSDKCVFTRGIETLRCPTAHGEGNFYAEKEVLEKLRENNQIILQYTNPSGELADGEFPYNPNGSLDDIAGICDSTGRIFGMMPHPDANLFFSNSDDFTLQKEILKRKGRSLPEEGEGLKIFRNAVEYYL